MTHDTVQRALGVRETTDSGFARLRAVADAVLYEGYLLYPYRRSSPKNRVRWQFGVVAPRAWVEADGPVSASVAGSVESWRQQTECLVEARPEAMLHVRVRYLQAQHKQVERRTGDGRYVPVESFETAGAVQLTFDEAVPREIDVLVPLSEVRTGERKFPVGAPGGEEIETLADGAGRVVRRRETVEAVATVRSDRLAGHPRRHRLRVRVENTAQAIAPDASRAEALGRSLIATHTFIGGRGVEFHSLIDPPPGAEDAARGCRNIHTFPVLASDAAAPDVVLSSPILLPDHPQVAPESPGDLYDAAEIDEILSLRTLLLTDEEKREARATDRRAAEILDRVDRMPPEVFARLHGAVRSLRGPSPAAPLSDAVPAAPPRPSVPWWREGGDDGLAPATDSVPVGGVAVRRGSRVRLRPRGKGADAYDMFLADRSARVEGVFHDVDGGIHLAVALDDDPAAELHGWYGRFFYFRPDELEPLPGTPEERSDGCHRAVDA